MSGAEAVADEDVDEQTPYSVRLASKYASANSPRAPEERRQYLRRRDRDLAWVRTVRLKSAGDVSLVDLSAGGALLDADVPLRPGAVLSLEIVGDSLETVVSLRVLRCHVAALTSDSARYRGACEFTRPLELPDIHPHSDPTAPSDALIDLDFALKQLVDRAYDPNVAVQLASGDVMLALQSLARRASRVESDLFGQRVGRMLDELVPALRHGQGLPDLLGTIERELCQALPDTRVRLAHGSTPAPVGGKSVLISAPGGAAASRAVSIDLPAGAVVNDAQARLLRASSRLIALVQRLKTFAAIRTPADARVAVPRIAAELSEPGAASAGWQKIVVRYTEGRILKGFTQDFSASRTQFSLWPSIDAGAHERVIVPMARLKAVFFVREFAGDPDYVEQKTFDQALHGRRIEVTLHDDEVVVGTTLSYRPDCTGFFVSPADPRTNNLRVFVVANAVRLVRFP